tara:strand:- start:604 stop:1839 length:1236 start_codon:yes stop_codon:yes gene_type:complete
MPLPTGEEALFYYNEIRREKTGVHALVAIALGGEGETILAHDTFNIGRHADRTRLVNAAHGMLGEVHKEAWPKEEMQHDLDTCSLTTSTIWEEQRNIVVEYDPREVPEAFRFALEPFIIFGGGTVFFGPPGAGKSYLLQAMAVSIATGSSKLWPVSAAPVLYINLERSAASLHRRERAVMRALGLNGHSGVSYLHGRGSGLAAVERTARAWVRENDGLGGVMLDSVSRTGLGKLNEDETANRFIDVMNGLNSSWWTGIGHTPRRDDTHQFGSVHFDAGEDIGVQVKSESIGTKLGMSLKVVKGNDIGRAPVQYLAFEFSDLESPVMAIRSALSHEFPSLRPQSEDESQQLYDYVLSSGAISATDAARETGIERTRVTRMFGQAPFRKAGMRKQSVLYAVSDSTHREGYDTP